MIKANFNTYASYVTDSLYQWDLNQVLSVSGLNLAVVPEVHFSNANMDKAIVRQATKVKNVVSVAIPNSLLQDPLTIHAHIGIYEGDTFKVVERVDIPVIPKKRPSDYRIEDADEEIYSFQALENALRNKADNARVDNIIAHNNDTAGNTELIDIRTAADGNTYGSAGESVRKQYAQLQNGIYKGVLPYSVKHDENISRIEASIYNSETIEFVGDKIVDQRDDAAINHWFGLGFKEDLKLIKFKPTFNVESGKFLWAVVNDTDSTTKPLDAIFFNEASVGDTIFVSCPITTNTILLIRGLDGVLPTYARTSDLSVTLRSASVNIDTNTLTFNGEDETGLNKYIFGGTYWFADSIVDVVELSEKVDRLSSKKTKIEKNIVVMGDSITADPTWWTYYLNQIVEFKSFTLLARSGATWLNQEDTVYNVTSMSGSLSSDNNIWNQFNNMKSKIDSGEIATPDVIAIYAGTNDQWYYPSRFGSVETAFAIDRDIISEDVTSILTTCDAIRYVVELIRNEYPNCQIILATPLQRGIKDQSEIFDLRNLIVECANKLSCQVIDQTCESGIYGYSEYKEHKYLYDGTHTTNSGEFNGAELVGKYNAKKLSQIILY